MCPRRNHSSDRGRAGTGARRASRALGAGSPGPGRIGGPGERRTRLSHWRADGAAKTRFSSEGEANRYALLVRLEYGNDVGAYLCEFCRGWHLGGVSGQR